MKIPNKESLLLDPIISFLKKESYTEQCNELPFYEHRIDIYGFSCKYDLTVAIELKLRKWQRALQQALLYQLCADRVFIAVPEETSIRMDKSDLLKHGIGLLSVQNNGQCRIIIQAKSSIVLNTLYRNEYKNMLIEVSK